MQVIWDHDISDHSSHKNEDNEMKREAFNVQQSHLQTTNIQK